MSKLVSIVLPTYNGERFIRDSIESVINQTYKNWELIIVNDCSKDNTLEIAQEYAQKDSRIRIISNETNLNLPASLNVGFRDAKGELYTWTSDDNMFRANAIEFMVNYLTTNPDCDLVSCNFDFIKEDKTFECLFCLDWKRNFLELARGCNVGACFMYTAEITKKVGEYDETMFCAEDYEYWCRIALAGNIHYLDENLYLYRNNSQSLTATKQKTIQARTMEIREKFALDIMKKGKMTTKAKVDKLMFFYLEDQNKFWLKSALKLNPIQAYCYLFKHHWKLFCEDFRFLNELRKNKNKKLVFWGASLFLEEILSRRSFNKNTILGIIDMNSSRHGTKIGNYEIFPPEKLSELKPDCVLMTVKNRNERVYKSVKEYLETNNPEIKLLPNTFPPSC